MVTSPSMQDEVAFITGVKADGTLTPYSYWGWNKDNPATYNSTWTRASKFGGTQAGTAGGTVAYYFNPNSNWSATEQAQLASGLALWAAVANINFVQTTDSSKAKITFNRGTDGGAYTYTIYSASSGACANGGTTLGTITSSPISLDTSQGCFSVSGGFSNYGGYGIETFLHEEGHALGLGHAGPYNGSVNNSTQQYSAYDNRQWSIMSYIDGGASSKYSSQNPVQGTNWNGHYPTTWMPLDILAIQRLYGVAVNTPLSGGQTFGFHCNVDASIKQYFDFTVNKTPVITIWDKGTNNTLDLSGFSTNSTINLNAGTYSSTAGMTNNIAIAYDTAVDTLVCSAGANTVTCNNDGDKIIGGTGNDTFIGGTGNDTFIGGGGTNIVRYSGNFAAYTIATNSDGSLTISGNGAGTDSLTGIQTLVFADKTVSTSSLTAVTSPTPPPVTPSAPVHQRDFNADGKGDILLAISGNTSVQVWLMNGTTRTSATTIAAPNSNYTNILSGDVDGDGKTDILWQNHVTGAIEIVTMNGVSKTSSAILSDATASWTMVAAGDFNGDGKADLLLQNGSQLETWLMNGTSILSNSTISTAAPSGFSAVSTGDFNGDGKADVLWQNSTTGALEIWQMNGNTVASDTVLASNPGASWHVITTADFNGDGKSDILLQDSSTGQLQIMLMDGSTVLSNSGTLGSNPGTSWKACGAADYNGDGFADVLLRNSSNGQYMTYMMSGTGIISSGALSVNPGTGWHAVGDSITPPPPSAQTLPTTTTPASPPPTAATPLPQRDFNGDGKGDLLLAINGNTSVQVWTMNGTSRVSAATIAPPNSNYSTILSGDVNGDGKTDILWQNHVTGAVDIITMNGTSKTSSTVLTNTTANWTMVAAGDFNGDGKADILFQNGGQLQTWQMNGNSILSSSILSKAAPTGSSVIATGDFNGDGKADILWQNSTTGSLEIWQMNGNSVASDTVLSSNPGANWHAVTTGDFNGDGKSDILLQDNTSGQLQVMLMDGSNILSTSGTLDSNPGTAWKACGSADYNGDGFSDVLLRNGSTGQYMAYTMSGTTVLASGALSVNPGTGWHAVAG